MGNGDGDGDRVGDGPIGLIIDLCNDTDNVLNDREMKWAPVHRVITPWNG